MTKRSLLQAEILEKLAAPLASAVGEVFMRTSEGTQQGPQEEAKRTAELLGKAVQLATSFVTKLNVKGADGDAEIVRTMLTILSGTLVADFYRRTARIPADHDLKKITSSLEATLAFSDNFIASEEACERIRQMKTEAVYVDENQRVLQFINTFVPVVNVVAGFSFGRSESVLMQEIAERLMARASALRKASFGDSGDPGDSGLAELIYLRGLVDIYVQCHNEEVEKMKGSDTGFHAAQDPITPVWEAFDLRATMMETLVGYIAPFSKEGVARTGLSPIEKKSENLPSKNPAQEEPQKMNTPAQPQIFSSQEVMENPVEAKKENIHSSAEETEPSDSIEENTNPMSFFSGGKNKEKDDDGYV